MSPKRRAELLAAGLCAKACGRPAAHPRHECQECLAKRTAYAIAYRAAKKARRIARGAPAHVRRRGARGGMERCTLKLTSNRNTPWREALTDPVAELNQTGVLAVRLNARVNPDRPTRWHEIVNVAERRIVLHSQKPAASLRPVLQPGERLVLAVRDSNREPGKARRYWL